MTERHALSDEEWKLLEGLIPSGRGRPGGNARVFISALMWIATTGSPWRDLPSSFGAWSLVYQRFFYWCKKDWIEAIFDGVQEPDLEEVMMDSSCCRAHQASAGARKSSGPQAIGVTRGGLNTKVHALCDALGNPIRLVLSPGQRHDSKMAVELLSDVPAQAVLADKAYDSKEIATHAQDQGMEVAIPSKASCKQPRPTAKHRYKARHLVENLFQRMKVFRRVATRFDKLDRMFLGFVHLAAIKKWLH
jgi:transposase